MIAGCNRHVAGRADHHPMPADRRSDADSAGRDVCERDRILQHAVRTGILAAGSNPRALVERSARHSRGDEMPLSGDIDATIIREIMDRARVILRCGKTYIILDRLIPGVRSNAENQGRRYPK
ncbi:MAG: hypothetical protein B7Z70_12325 [Acidithiobacillus ferrivorans]|uniref:Uncharacterized protein n=1 Tax=Acidithiobacillus ferrivorans TaxID=160808 RepID=A0A257SM22_9PROT|nr:MAG: hypothetical protein B7Z70_12325 [Acidithiobacillus ferrivorans]